MKDKNGMEHDSKTGQFTSGGSTPAEHKRADEITGGTKKNIKFEKANEFRYINNHENPKAKGHPAHIYAKNDDQAKYMQLTHSKFIRDMREANIKLKNNPNPKDNRTAYIIPKSEIADLKDLGKIKNGWKLSDIDDKTIVIYRDEPFNEKK